MAEVMSKTEAFFAGASRWPDELRALRAVLLDTPLTEDFKWRAPCYTFRNGNVATLWGLRDACVLSFFKGVLLDDPWGVLVAPGEYSRSVRMLQFHGVEEIAARNAQIRHFVHAAIALEKAERKVAFPKEDLPHPAELALKLQVDPQFRTAFNALTPGRRRGYVLHFSRAKQAATRTARIEKAVPRILDGKGLNDR